MFIAFDSDVTFSQYCGTIFLAHASIHSHRRWPGANVTRNAEKPYLCYTKTNSYRIYNNGPGILLILVCLGAVNVNLVSLQWYVFTKMLSTLDLSWPHGRSVIVASSPMFLSYVGFLCRLLEPLRLFIDPGERP